MDSRYFFTAAMDIPAEKEKLFDDVYNTEHIPYLSEVSGVLSIARFTTQPLRMVMGRGKRNHDRRSAETYCCL